MQIRPSTLISHDKLFSIVRSLQFQRERESLHTNHPCRSAVSHLIRGTTNPRASKSRGLVFVRGKLKCTALVEVLVGEDCRSANCGRENRLGNLFNQEIREFL